MIRFMWVDAFFWCHTRDWHYFLICFSIYVGLTEHHSTESIVLTMWQSIFTVVDDCERCSDDEVAVSMDVSVWGVCIHVQHALWALKSTTLISTSATHLSSFRSNSKLKSNSQMLFEYNDKEKHTQKHKHKCCVPERQRNVRTQVILFRDWCDESTGEEKISCGKSRVLSFHWVGS